MNVLMCLEYKHLKKNMSCHITLHIVKDVVVVKLFPSIHPIIYRWMASVTRPSIHGWHHTGKKTLAEINKPPSAHVSLSRKGMPGPRLQSITMVSCMLPSHGSQAVQTSRFSAARVPHTCGMWHIERFWKCSL
jgi:hypothetical protein